MEYREMLYNWATQKKPPEATEGARQYKSTIGERKEDFWNIFHCLSDAI